MCPWQLFAFWVAQQLPVEPLSQLILSRVTELGLAVGEVMFGAPPTAGGNTHSSDAPATTLAVARLATHTATLARQVQLPPALLLRAAALRVQKLDEVTVRCGGWPRLFPSRLPVLIGRGCVTVCVACSVPRWRRALGGGQKYAGTLKAACLRGRLRSPWSNPVALRHRPDLVGTVARIPSDASGLRAVTRTACATLHASSSQTLSAGWIRWG